MVLFDMFIRTPQKPTVLPEAELPIPEDEKKYYRPDSQKI